VKNQKTGEILKKKNILITGSVRRIGLAIAESFFREGYKLIMHYNKSEHDAKLLAEKFNAKMVQCDFLNATNKDLKKLVKECDVLINNASVYWTKDNPIYKTEKGMDRMQKKINYEIPIKLMEFFAEENRTKLASIINILDASALKNGSDSYTESKYLLSLATKEYAVKLAPNIRVNGIAPGPVLPPDWCSQSTMKKSIENMLLKKPPTSADIAEACLFLTRTLSITGEIIKIDSGYNL